MSTIACPICAGPVELTGTKPACLIGHDFEPDGLQVDVDDAASRALWSAVRALEDSASGARWRATLPHPPPHLEVTIERASREALLLRDLIEHREEGKSDTSERPPSW
ncbi:MAG TPA: hypothetical protein VFX52_13410 [Nocardioidaceae bacterium]|jgi:hypothetical protein|nr:hypothetical protein [Nocardioidaceae bacterium]